MNLSNQIKNKALEIGFSKIGIAKAQFYEQDANNLNQWLSKGFHGSMDWIKNRFMERTSWDGGALIAVGVIGLFFSAIIPMNIICWAAIAWGVVTMMKSED